MSLKCEKIVQFVRQWEVRHWLLLRMSSAWFYFSTWETLLRIQFKIYLSIHPSISVLMSLFALTVNPWSLMSHAQWVLCVPMATGWCCCTSDSWPLPHSSSFSLIQGQYISSVCVPLYAEISHNYNAVIYILMPASALSYTGNNLLYDWWWSTRVADEHLSCIYGF